ncbi:hypothetical protein P175DRAFT_0496936 [Aspergillus ochraceoroseus IBT 24754]|nr:uncharacterized protein P175DRAFT_0496936 [Aspergillus ochraceoroseus IBT 24754]PTU23806.1 hypothetical protein P175DRAFT_0496936 [Aspergillus ochraceoroseus IBT 24754]
MVRRMLERLTLLIALFAVASARQVVVDLGYARYSGQALSNGVAQWLGVRYAEPPLGPLRFAAPQDPEDIEGIQDASEHGPLCIPTGEYPIPSNTSEDCLYLDVYAPAGFRGSSSKLLPVFVFIQGGGFNSNGNAYYNGTGLIQAANMGIVVVNFNYRVGPYGFLSGAEVSKDGSLNNGLKDQIQVLKWVQEYISNFGGDPNHVVIGGASAGAASVTLLLSAYGGRDDGLFHAAAAESQSFATMLTVEESQFAYNNLVIRTGCTSSPDTLACLRSLDINTLQQSNIATSLPGAQQAPLYFYAPVLDEDLVPDYTYRLFEDGRFLKNLPVIFGDVTNEGTRFVPANISSPAQADTFLQAQFPALQLSHLAHINALYLQPNQTVSFPDSAPYWRPTSNAYGDMRYTCPGIAMSSIYAAASSSASKSWNYHYAVQDPMDEASGVGVYHVAETAAIWGPQYVSNSVPSSYFTTNAAIVPVVQAYWTSFIRSFDPNTYRSPGSPVWESWNGDSSGATAATTSAASESGGTGKRIFLRTGETRMESVPVEQRERCDYLIGIGVDIKQ